jgi:transposase-like protein
MAHLTVEIQDKTLHIKSQAFSLKFKDVGKNRKALFVFLRHLYVPETEKSLFTNESIAKAFGYKDRQNIDNFVREFHANDDDLHRLLARNQSKKDQYFSEIESRILHCPALSIAQHYRSFCDEHPTAKLSETTFRTYVNAIEGIKILKRIRQFWSKEQSEFDGMRYLQELFEWDSLGKLKKKEIVELFPEAQACPARSHYPDGLDVSTSFVQKQLLVVLLYVCNLSQEMLSLLFGVSKTSIHNYIYTICSEDLDWQILSTIGRWSGQVSFDEKWLKIKQEWYFVLCAVDSVSGFPLLMDIYPSLDGMSWSLFFKRFHALYGLPKLILSDGSNALAAARKAVFPSVRYQLCKFHKLKNLMKYLRQHIRDPKLLKRSVRLAKNIFRNKSVSSRKHAAKTLQLLAGEEGSSYINEHILGSWRHLTMSLTNNASERFNRKIKKCFSGRYGIPSVESAHVLLRGLWLKELLFNGHRHMALSCEFRSMNVSRIFQEHLDTSKILHSFHDYDVSQAAKLA